MTGKKILLYIVYGDNIQYYQSVKFSILTFLYYIKKEKQEIDIVVLTENCKEFENYPITVIQINKKQKDKWSLNNKYHFRIKNRGLAFVVNKFNFKKNDKILCIDADTYASNKSLKLFDLINDNQVIMYRNEGLISKKKRFKGYYDSLINNQILVDNNTYKLSNNSSMWGSAITGITANMIQYINYADKLIVKFLDTIPSHTIEQFALGESLSRDLNIIQGKNYINIYSTSAKQIYAQKVLSRFFNENKDEILNNLIQKASKLSMKRPIIVIIKQKLKKIFTTGESL